MINSLVVKNFKCLENLVIRNFNRINLLTGKNNTGKSTLLEAVALFATKGDFEILKNIIAYRGISFEQSDISKIDKIAGLFSNWQKDYSEFGSIKIAELHPSFTEDLLSLRLVKYYEDDSNTNSAIPFGKRIIVDGNDPSVIDDINVYTGLQRSLGESSSLLPLESFGRIREGNGQHLMSFGFQFVRPGVYTDKLNSRLWDKIALTTKENRVIEALKIIHPSLSGLSFVQVGENRIPIARLTDSDVVLPLKSMGDGMNRILSLVLALVNAQNGVLLIDEFENGLHYTVQKELWNLIFQLSVTLDVQIFATTHSSDCIDAFCSVMEISDNMNIGSLVRLENKDGRIESVEYNPEELKIAKQFDLETR